MAGTTAVLLVMGAVCVTIVTFLLLVVLLRRKSPFNKRHRANALAALEGGRRSESSSMTELEKAPVPSPSRDSQSRYNPSRHNAAASQMSIPSIVMTASHDGPEIAKPAPTRKSQIYRQSALRQSMLAVGEPGPEVKESGLLPPPAIGRTNRNSRGSKTWSILSIGGWQKRKTVRLTHFAM